MLIDVRTNIHITQEINVEDITDQVEEELYDYIYKCIQEANDDIDFNYCIVNSDDVKTLQNAVIKELYLRLDKNNK